MSEPFKVVVTGAAGQIAYSLLYIIANGDVFGRNRPIHLHLLDIPPMMGVLEGVVMELIDCAFPNLLAVVPTADPSVAFKDVSAAFLVGAMPRKEGMERKDLLSANVKIFKAQGEALDIYAQKNVKVLVVGNPANTNALICQRYAPSIPKENFTAMTRLDLNRAKAQIAIKADCPVSAVHNVIIWGNHSSTQFPDANHGYIITEKGQKVNIPAKVPMDWLRNDFVSIVQKRGAAVINTRKMSSAMSAARAAADHMKDWFLGTASDEFTTMGVISDGSYGTPEDVIFSFPVTIDNMGNWTVVRGLALDEYAKKMIQTTSAELLEEKMEATKVIEA